MGLSGGEARQGSDGLGVVVPTKVPRFELVVLALGFGLCRAWVVAAMSLANGYVLVDDNPFGYDQIFLLTGAAAAAFAAFFAPRLFDSRRGLNRLNVATAFLMAAALAVLAAACATGIRPLCVAAFVLCGAASAVLQVMWGERFVRHSMYLALIAAPASAIVTAIVMIFLPSSFLSAFMYLAPVASFVLLCANRGEAGSLVLSLQPQPEDAALLNGVEGERPDPISIGTFVRLMASIAVFSLVGRCLDSFPVSADDSALPGFFLSNYPFLAIFAVGVLFIVLVVALGKRFDTLFIYRLSLPCMVAGFVILTLFMDRFTALSITVITIGYEFFDVLFWAVLVGVVRRGGHKPVFVFGWGVAATYAGMALGTLLSRVAVAPIMEGALDISVLSLMCILVLVVLVVLVLPEGTLSKASAGPRRKMARKGDDYVVRHCEITARRYDLTPREHDVLVLLARGRTLSVVARELGIAEGTARTHMGHIYTKLDVHKQQELIDLVDAAEERE